VYADNIQMKKSSLMENVIEVNKLTVSYVTDQGKVKALDDVYVTIKKGSVRGVIGESGCGKSTLAKSILQILPAAAEIESGEVLFHGVDLLRKSDNELRAIRGKAITLIPQDPFDSLNPVFTIETQMRDIVAPKLFPKRIVLNRSKVREKIRRLVINKLKQVQLPSPEKLLCRYPHELSGGQKQRILIAAALLLNPLLVVADEPTTSLDVTVEAQILELLKDLISEYKTSTLYITHNLDVASAICDYITVMYCGQIIESAPSDSFFTNPAHPYSRKLLECLPKPGRGFIDIPGRVPSLIVAPQGCRFHPRCERRLKECSKERPPQMNIGAGHWICCYNPDLN